VSDDPTDPLLHVTGLRAGLDVVVAQAHAQVLNIVTAQMSHAVGGGEDVVVVDQGAATELPVPVHDGSHKRELVRHGLVPVHDVGGEGQLVIQRYHGLRGSFHSAER